MMPGPTPQPFITRADAEARSNALARECEAMFWRFAKRHRVTPDEARILIQDTGTRI